MSVVILAAFLYSAILPQGPQLFSGIATNAAHTSWPAEMAIRAEKFTPE